eukprot:gene13433-11403_t
MAQEDVVKHDKRMRQARHAVAAFDSGDPQPALTFLHEPGAVPEADSEPDEGAPPAAPPPPAAAAADAACAPAPP